MKEKINIKKDRGREDYREAVINVIQSHGNTIGLNTGERAREIVMHELISHSSKVVIYTPEVGLLPIHEYYDVEKMIHSFLDRGGDLIILDRKNNATSKALGLENITLLKKDYPHNFIIRDISTEIRVQKGIEDFYPPGMSFILGDERILQTGRYNDKGLFEGVLYIGKQHYYRKLIELIYRKGNKSILEKLNFFNKKKDIKTKAPR
jgi:hypothetical protein